MQEIIQVSGQQRSQSLFVEVICGVPVLSYRVASESGIGFVTTPYTSKIRLTSGCKTSSLQTIRLTSTNAAGKLLEWGLFDDSTQLSETEIHARVINGDASEVLVAISGGRAFRGFLDCEMSELLRAGYLIDSGSLKLFPFSDKSTINFGLNSLGYGQVNAWVSGIDEKIDPDEKVKRWLDALKKDFKA